LDHFRAVCRFGHEREGLGQPPTLLTEVDPASASVPIDPDRDLYGGILFHRGRFQRLAGYRHLRGKQCIAEITSDGSSSWFGQFLPDDFVLGDPAARDTVVHAVQACIPQGTLLPIAVDRIVISDTPTVPAAVRARERSRQADEFVYDLEVTGADGSVQELWEGLRLRRVSETAPCDTWNEVLLGPYLERRLEALLGDGAVSIAVERRKTMDRRAGSDLALQRALASNVEVHRRPDGKPEVDLRQEVSVSHAGGLTMAVASEARVACDAQPVHARSRQDWRDLLGPDRFDLAETVATRAGEDFGTAATRVWSAGECLVKAGVHLDAPLVFDSATEDGWVVLTAGTLRTGTTVTPVRGTGHRIVFAVCVETCLATEDVG
jgi:enediyne polyketide synthase